MLRPAAVPAIVLILAFIGLAVTMGASEAVRDQVARVGHGVVALVMPDEAGSQKCCAKANGSSSQQWQVQGFIALATQGRELRATGRFAMLPDALERGGRTPLPELAPPKTISAA